MTTRTEMVARVRQELGDTTAPYVWDDTYLHNLVIEANDWYSRQFPRRGVGYQDVVAGQRSWAISPAAYGVVSVECPPGKVLPQDPTPIVGDPTSHTIRYRQAWALFGSTLYLRNPASGDEIGSSKLVVLQLMGWDRPDPFEPWNGPEGDVKLLVLWAAREAWLWHDGQTQRLNRKVGVRSQAERFEAALQYELKLRRRKASSRVLEVQG
jgi:hypothetical protein